MHHNGWQLALAHRQPVQVLLRLHSELVKRAVAVAPARVARALVRAHALPVQAAVRVAERAAAVLPHPPFVALASLLRKDKVPVVALLVAEGAVPTLRAHAEVRLRALAVRARLCAHRLLTAPALVAVLAGAVTRAQALAVHAPLVAHRLLAEASRVPRLARAGAVARAPLVAETNLGRFRFSRDNSSALDRVRHLPGGITGTCFRVQLHVTQHGST
mmetsp:Transcript_40967/g.76749  ORF Transcript_40967/g.76749 Transcript_40967/m.76749 type:complete len:217 (+) Transcript_40967:1355-2005(+)